jgi:hypothetical protein
MIRIALLVVVTATAALAGTAAAQGAPKDVPSGHWASAAVKELQSRGLMLGYPDGTFGGKRAVNCYEFALAGQRLLRDVQRRIDSAAALTRPATASPLATREETGARIRGLQASVGQVRGDVDELRGTMSRLQARASSLRTDIDEMRHQLGDARSAVSGIKSQRLLGGVYRP